MARLQRWLRGLGSLPTLEAKLTKTAYESLCRVPPFERKALALSDEPLLHLVRSEPTIALETEALSPTEEQMLAELRGLTDKLLTKYGLDPGLLSSSDGDDAA